MKQGRVVDITEDVALRAALINDAVRDELAEDARDLAVFDARANEPTVDFEDFVKGLKRDGTI